MVEVDFEDATGCSGFAVEDVRHWVQSALAGFGCTEPMEVAIRMVDRDEGRALNSAFRGKDYATNVLSFPADCSIPEGPRLLGDLALCWPVLVDEAQSQGKSVTAHSAHLVVHGILHLMGLDHETSVEADAMEALEIGILEKLGYPNPY